MTPTPAPAATPTPTSAYTLAVQWALQQAANNYSQGYLTYEGECLEFVYTAYAHQDVDLNQEVAAGTNTYPQDILPTVETLKGWVAAPPPPFSLASLRIPQGAIIFFLNTGGNAIPYGSPAADYDRILSHVVISTGQVSSVDHSVWTISSGTNDTTAFSPINDPAYPAFTKDQYDQGSPATPDNVAQDRVHTETLVQLGENDWRQYRGYWLPSAD